MLGILRTLLWQRRSRLETSKALTAGRTFSCGEVTVAGLSGIAELDKLCRALPFAISTK